MPAATPREIVSLLYAEITRSLLSGEMKERLAAMGATPGGGSPEQFVGFIRTETDKWAKVVKNAGLKAEKGSMFGPGYFPSVRCT